MKTKISKEVLEKTADEFLHDKTNPLGRLYLAMERLHKEHELFNEELQNVEEMIGGEK